MIRNVIFDLGGVVLGRDFVKYGTGSDSVGFLHGGDVRFPKYWLDFDLGLVSQPDVARAIAADTGLTFEEAFELVTQIGVTFNEFPQTVELIRELHEAGYRLYVLSNMPLEYWEHMKKMEVFRLFDGIVISSVEKMAKPDPAFFRLLLDRYGLKPEETLFVDDKQSNTSAAVRLGMEAYTFDTATGPDGVRKLLGLAEA